jgi:hypothetical protein
MPGVDRLNIQKRQREGILINQTARGAASCNLAKYTWGFRVHRYSLSPFAGVAFRIRIEAGQTEHNPQRELFPPLAVYRLKDVTIFYTFTQAGA